MKYNYGLEIVYDGTRYSGWQKNKNAQNTIQEKIETVIRRMIEQDIDLIGSGRTDRGVHANGQVANFFTTKPLACASFLKEMNQYLPEDICVLKMVKVDEQFHARLKATGKKYVYTYYKTYLGQKPVFDRKFVADLEKSLNLKKISLAIEKLKGTHDFKGFCSDKTKKTTIRTINDIIVEDSEDRIKFVFIGDGFLHHMIRILVGTLVEIGWNEREVSTIETIYENKIRSEAGLLAPASGLTLEEVYYEHPIFVQK